jgi:hypothetical protein
LTAQHPALLRLAQGLIAAGVLLATLAFAARAADVRAGARRGRAGGALGAAALAYLAHLASHRPSPRELILRSGLVAAFLLWAIVQVAPSFHGAALLNDGAIVLFIADLAFVLMPWRLAEH